MYFIYHLFSVVLSDNKKVTGSNLDKIVEQISQELWMSACCNTFCLSLFFHLMLKLNTLIPKYTAEKIIIYIAEHSELDVGNFIPECSFTGVLWSTASDICDGNFRSFLPQCITVLPKQISVMPLS